MPYSFALAYCQLKVINVVQFSRIYSYIIFSLQKWDLADANQACRADAFRLKVSRERRRLLRINHVTPPQEK